MSIRVMAQVWAQSTLKGSSLLLLLAIADHADDDGVAYPSVESLSQKIRMSERQTRALIRLGEELGELVTKVGEGPHGANLYRVRPGGRSLPPQGAVQRRLGGSPASFRGAVATAPEPSVTIKNRGDVEKRDARWRRHSVEPCRHRECSLADGHPGACLAVPDNSVA